MRTALRLEGNVKRQHLAKYNNEVLEEKRLKFLYDKVIVAFVGTGRRLVRRRRQLLLLATAISDALVTINSSINMAFDPHHQKVRVPVEWGLGSCSKLEVNNI